MPIPTNEQIAKAAETARDLRQKVDGIATESLPGIVFLDLSEGRTPVTIYSTEDGRPIVIPEFMLRTVIDKRREDGEYRFVADKADAPEYKMGTILCFMHKDSPERATLDAAGLGGKFCRKHTLPSDYAATIHAEHRHRQEYAAYSRYVAGQKEAVREARQDRQLEATLSIARAANPQAPPEPQTTEATGEHDCGDCDWRQKPNTKNPAAALRMHARAKHTAESPATV